MREKLQLGDADAADLPRVELCHRYGVRELSLFGSAARGEMRPEERHRHHGGVRAGSAGRDATISLRFFLALRHWLGYTIFVLQQSRCRQPCLTRVSPVNSEVDLYPVVNLCF